MIIRERSMTTTTKKKLIIVIIMSKMIKYLLYCKIYIIIIIKQ